jgi:hypothetical protein
MRSFQVFAAMSPDEATRMLGVLKESTPGMFVQALAAASVAMKARPRFLQKQPLAKQAQAVRRAMARVTADAAASELLAVYFLECRKELLVGWLDSIGLAHEEGILEADAPPQPGEAELRKAVDAFLSTDDDPDRKLLLQAFAAQEAVEWPVLESLVTDRDG